jgi:hypothetical protein
MERRPPQFRVTPSNRFASELKQIRADIDAALAEISV